MILSDDNFATIVFAVEQGRKIYDNLTKYIRFVLVLLVAFVLTFLGATVFNIAAGEPFTPPRSCGSTSWSTPRSGSRSASTRRPRGLMGRQAAPTRGVGADQAADGHGRAGRAGHHHRPAVADQAGRVAVRQRRDRQSIAFTSFALCLIVAAFECRSETDSVLTTETFDSKQMNWVAGSSCWRCWSPRWTASAAS